MGLHTGDPCFACGKKIMEDDDVVVCPECGTPYHRSCWEKNGKCINIWLHRDGKTWERPSEPEPEKEITFSKKVITERDIIEANRDGVKVIRITERNILTALAKDAASARNIRLVRE